MKIFVENEKHFGFMCMYEHDKRKMLVCERGHNKIIKKAWTTCMMEWNQSKKHNVFFPPPPGPTTTLNYAISTFFVRSILSPHLPASACLCLLPLSATSQQHLQTSNFCFLHV